MVKTSYNKEDVVILLKDISSSMTELSTEEREKLIQSGVHYSEMLPQESEPSKEYEALYERALSTKTREIANNIARVSEIMLSELKGKKPVIVSLARAGIPVGILMKRYIKMVYKIDVEHYAISIIRDRGIDVNAMDYIYNNEVIANCVPVEDIFFVDGWTGKGAIKSQLKQSVVQLQQISDKWKNLRDDLYVLADPANITPFRGTDKDYLLPTSCLNSTVCGLISRTILNKYVDVPAGDFHGAVYFKKFEDKDKSIDFIDRVSSEFKSMKPNDNPTSKDNIDTSWNGMSIVNQICEEFGINDNKKVKPGIGETTRVLLRRVPWKVLVNTNVEMNDPDIEHIILLCKEKGVPVERYKLGNYKVCGIIKELSADA